MNNVLLNTSQSLANKRKASNHDNWISALRYLDNFTNGNLKFADLNQKFLEDFKEYLLTTKSNRSNKTTLSQNSAVSYFNKVKAALKASLQRRDFAIRPKRQSKAHTISRNKA